MRGQEYAGRQDTTLDGEKKITEIDKIPGVPYNLNPTANVEEQEHSAECRQMAIESKCTNFDKSMNRKVKRRTQRKEGERLMA